MSSDQPLFRDLVETSQDLIWQVDGEGRYTYLNPAWEETLGYSLNEMLGRRFSEFQSADQAAADLELFQELLRGGLVKGYETVHLHKSGRPVNLVFSAKAHFDRQRRITGTWGTAHDATASKQLEAELRRSREGYRRLFEDMPLAFLTTDPTFGILESNAASQKFLGYSADELRRMTFRDFTLPDQVGPDLEGLQKVSRGELPVYRTTKQYRTKSGELIWGLVTVSAIRDERGQLQQFLVGIADVTEIKRGEEALARAQRVGQIGSYECELAENRWTASAQRDEIFGIDRASPRTLASVLQLVHPDDRAAVERGFEAVITHREPLDLEYRLARQREGRDVWVHDRCVVAQDAQGCPTRLVGTVRDISARKQAELELRASEEKYRTLIDELNVGVFQSTLDGKFLHLNRATARTAGYSSVEEMLQVPAARLYADAEARQRLVDSLSRDGAVRGQELRSLRKDGTTYPVEITAVLLRDRQGVPGSILGTVADISERKRADEAIQRAQRLESLGLLAGGIAHDFNNLLMGIFGFIELAERRAQDPEQLELLRNAREPMARARALTQQLLTFAKGGQPARRVATIEPVLRGAVRFALSGAPVKGVLEIDEGLRPCNHDPHQIARVVENLLINAVQAMPLGGTITVRACNQSVSGHPTLAPGDYVRISVEDQGVGITPEVLPRIFDPYFTTKQTGSGLGLATAFSIVRRHEGTIEVSSEPGRGSAFTFFLPAAEHGAVAQAAPSPTVEPGHGTVLVMDDEPTVRVSIERILRSLGYRCLSAGDGQGLLKLFEEARTATPPLRCAILDLTIAGGPGGIEVKNRLRGLGADIPILAVSGYSDDPVIADPAAYGFQGSLGKPFTVTALSQLLAATVHQR